VPGLDRDAVELRAVAPLIVAETRALLGPALLVSNGTETIAITSAELVRSWDTAQLAIALALDGATSVPVAAGSLGHRAGIALLELAGPVVAGPDVAPLDIGSVCATVDTRGAPAALVTIGPGEGARFARAVAPVDVDHVDGDGIYDQVMWLASPREPADGDASVEGATLFAWFPPDPVLGRPRELLALAIAYPYRQRIFQPRAAPVIAELVGLDDLGRALITAAPVPERPELHDVTGEVETRAEHEEPPP